MAVIRTSLGMCGVCTEPPYPNGDCECAVDMRVCDHCGNGPLTKEGPDVCGPCEITQAAEDAGLYEDVRSLATSDPLALRHQMHYRQCNCLGDSAVCCVRTCSCHEKE